MKPHTKSNLNKIKSVQPSLNNSPKKYIHTQQFGAGLNICIFEDEKFNNFYPLSLSRPVYQLKCGIYTLSEKIKFVFPKAQIFYHCREYLWPLLKKQGLKVIKNTKQLKNCLFINGRIISDNTLGKKFSCLKIDTLYYYNGELVAAYLSGKNLKIVKLNGDFTLEKNKLKIVKIKIKIVNFIWDFIYFNEEEIINDAARYNLGTNNGTIYPNVSLVDKKNIFIGKNTKIKPGVVIDAENGPVIIEKNCELMPNSVIIGPVFIGEKCKIKTGTKIYGGTTIGQVCKIGGEVEKTIFQEYTNKQHDGFLGHSYIGSWCNLGAGTVNSDLKNNYSLVEVILNNRKINTGRIFVGLFMGDHSKTGINTMFNTGSVIGFSCNVFGAGYLPKFIPSFSWFDTQKENKVYKIDKTVEIAKKVMDRRNIKFTKTDLNLFNNIYSIS